MGDLPPLERDAILQRIAEINLELDELALSGALLPNHAEKFKELAEESLELRRKLRGDDPPPTHT